MQIGLNPVAIELEIGGLAGAYWTNDWAWGIEYTGAGAA
jgi:hypothetical protein